MVTGGCVGVGKRVFASSFITWNHLLALPFNTKGSTFVLSTTKCATFPLVCVQGARQQEDQMQLEALLRSRDQEVSSLSHRSAVTALLVVSHTMCIAAWAWQLHCRTCRLGRPGNGFGWGLIRCLMPHMLAAWHMLESMLRMAWAAAGFHVCTAPNLDFA